MIAASVIQKLFSMIRSESKDAGIPHSGTPHSAHQPLHLHIYPANS